MDDSGEETELRTSMTISGGGTWNQTLECEQPIERAKIRVEMWKAPEMVRIPFDVTAGIGLR